MKASPRLFPLLVLALLLGGSLESLAQYPPGPVITKDGTAVLMEDYATAPLTGRTPNNFTYVTYPPPVNYADQLTRMNFLRSEPSNAVRAGDRFFVCDLNRYLYTLDRSNRQFSVYIDFEANFPKFDNNPGFAGGLVTFQFDPGYASNGIFYTVHTENPNKGSGSEPSNPNAVLPAGYVPTTVINPPVGTVSRQAVLVEWSDTDITNDTFEGTARELLRVGFSSNIHPMGDLIFNPLAQPGDWDYGNLYVSNGDGGAGEQTDARHALPQRLDTLVGKILRITPDLNLRPEDQISSNGRYRIPTNGPDPNPFAFTNAAFAGVPNLRKEIYAYGLRNPHRMSWDPDSGALFANEIGLHSWEEVNLMHKGTNYGYAEREGIENLIVSSGGQTGSRIGVPFPTNSDFLTVTGLVEVVVPTYPVANYSHEDGDAISSGFVYRGTFMPQLRGKYVFGDIVNARLLYCDLDDLLAADDGDRTTLAEIHEIQLVHDSPIDAPDAGPVPARLWDAVAVTYTNRGGSAGSQRLPGGNSSYTTWSSDLDGVPYGRGRADLRVAMGGDREIYLITKSDGTIRKLVAALSPPCLSISASNEVATLSWSAVPGRSYRVQFKSSLADAGWTDWPGDITAEGVRLTTELGLVGDRFYRVVESPTP